MTKQSYWIRDVEGAYAAVDGADARDTWTKVRGWSLADEPGPVDQVHVVNSNPDVGPGRLPYGALSAGMTGLGWSAGPPPEPYDLTKDPVLVDQAPAPVAAPARPKPETAAGGSSTQEK